jgi:NAD(P)-dependent dehydrogenase (short-subunit alcohol dehydrogenase family)
MTSYFDGKVALVTGASSGMGRATAQAFAEAGAAVVLADRNEETLRAATDELTSAGRKVLGVACDVADEAQVSAMVERAVAAFGRLGAAFNNAGVQSPALKIADVGNAEYERVMAINLRGVWNCMKHELRRMREQGSGAIVNCSSIGGLIGLPGRAAYHASKHGVIGLTRSLAVELGAKGVTVNCVCPGPIRTGMTDAIPEEHKDLYARRRVPLRRYGEPEEVAHATLSLVLPAASFVNGAVVVVDGGMHIRH